MAKLHPSPSHPPEISTAIDASGDIFAVGEREFRMFQNHNPPLISHLQVMPCRHNHVEQAVRTPSLGYVPTRNIPLKGGVQL
jgi:hypothetical protein